MNAYLAVTPWQSTLWLFLRFHAPYEPWLNLSVTEHFRQPDLLWFDPPRPTVPGTAFAFEIQLPIVPLGIDSLRATSGCVKPWPITILMASSLNSGLYFLCSFISCFRIRITQMPVSTKTRIDQNGSMRELWSPGALATRKLAAPKGA